MADASDIQQKFKNRFFLMRHGQVRVHTYTCLDLPFFYLRVCEGLDYME